MIHLNLFLDLISMIVLNTQQNIIYVLPVMTNNDWKAINLDILVLLNTESTNNL